MMKTLSLGIAVFAMTAGVALAQNTSPGSATSTQSTNSTGLATGNADLNSQTNATNDNGRFDNSGPNTGYGTGGMQQSPGSPLGSGTLGGGTLGGGIGGNAAGGVVRGSKPLNPDCSSRATRWCSLQDRRSPPPYLSLGPRPEWQLRHLS